MYTIYADGSPVYIAGNEQPSMAHHVVYDPVLTIAINTAGTLQFTMPPTNAMYTELATLKTIITVYSDSKEIWRGRVLTIDRNFWNEKVVKCEGELVFLNEYYQREFEFTGTIGEYIDFLLDGYNSACESGRQLRKGVITAGDSKSHYFHRKLPYSTLTLLKDHLVDKFGGFIRIRELNGERLLDYLAQGSISTQKITFGENLLDFNEFIDPSTISTVVIPLGKYNDVTQRRVDIKAVNGGKDYIENQDQIARYGRIETIKEFDDIEDPVALKVAGEEYLNKAVLLEAELTISAIDLALVDVNAEAFELGQQIECISEPHGIDEYFTLTKMELPLSRAGEEVYTFGAVKKAFTGTLAISNKEYVNTAETAEKAISGAENANENAFKLASIINEGLGLWQTRLDSGYYFHDKENLETSTTIWTINSNGFAVCTTGWNDGNPQWEYGSTAAGDAIFKTLSAKRINADDIYTGTIKSPSGKLQIDLTNDIMEVDGTDGANNSNISIEPNEYVQSTYSANGTLLFTIRLFRNQLTIKNHLSNAETTIAVGGITTPSITATSEANLPNKVNIGDKTLKKFVEDIAGGYDPALHDFSVTLPAGSTSVIYDLPLGTLPKSVCAFGNNEMVIVDVSSAGGKLTFQIAEAVPYDILIKGELLV